MDLEEVIQKYSRQWNKRTSLLIGYSFGADVLPYALNHASPSVKSQIRSVVLLQPGLFASYEVTWATQLNLKASGDPVLPEIEAMPLPLLLVCTNEAGSLCSQLPDDRYPRIMMPGNHSFDGKFTDLAEKILKQLP